MDTLLDRVPCSAGRSKGAGGGFKHRCMSSLDVLLLRMAEAETLVLEEFLHTRSNLLLPLGN